MRVPQIIKVPCGQGLPAVPPHGVVGVFGDLVDVVVDDAAQLPDGVVFVAHVARGDQAAGRDVGAGIGLAEPIRENTRAGRVLDEAATRRKPGR